MGWFRSTLLPNKLHLQLLSLLTFAVVLTLTHATNSSSSSVIKIDRFGVFPVEPDDVSMVFYANVSHTGEPGDENVEARLKMTQCCLHLLDLSSDCESMKLVTGMGQVLHPDHSELLQLYFMNLNLLDRNGTCEVRLLTRPQGVKSGWTKGEELTIPFNTLLPEPSLWQALWMSIGGKISGVRMDSPHMSHEDCQVRYGGSRSISSHQGTNISCEKTPSCEGNNNRLSPVTGLCGPPPTLRQIEDSFSPEMLEHSHRPPNKTRTKSAPTYIIKTERTAARFHVRSHGRPGLICEHGDLISKNGSGNCSCHPGWSTSQSYEEWVGERGTSTTAVYKMCDNPTFDRGSMGKLLIGGLVVVVVFLVCAILTCTCSTKKKRSHQSANKKDTKKYEALSKWELESNDEDEGEDDADQVITEVANRREAAYTFGRRDNKSQALPPPPPAVETRQDLDKDPRGTFSQMDYGRQEALSRKSSRSSKRRRGNQSNEEITGQLAFSTSSEFFLGQSSGGFSLGSSSNARRTSSTDELLDLSQNEKWTAHVPLNPLPSYTSSLEEVIVTDPNNNRGSSLSSSAESVTKQKKLEWVDYIKSASEERLSTKSWKFSGGKLLPVVEDEEAEEEDFVNNNNNAERASKVQSLPEMQFCSTPNPPPKLVEESVKAMKPEEFESRQLCYSILKSLSNPRLAPSTRREGMFVRSDQSIWSNVASENAEAPEPEVASEASSYSELRRDDLGSDPDSDSALKEIRTGGRPHHRLSVAESFAQNQKLLLEADQTPSDVYPESSGPSKVSSSEFWSNGQTSRSHAPTHTNPNSWMHNRLEENPSPEVESAYRVKSSLEQSLQASRSRSAANFF